MVVLFDRPFPRIIELQSEQHHLVDVQDLHRPVARAGLYPCNNTLSRLHLVAMATNLWLGKFYGLWLIIDIKISCGHGNLRNMKY